MYVCMYTVADPGFPRRGGGGVLARRPGVWDKNLFFDKNFAENCMKMKEIGQRDGKCPQGPLCSASDVCMYVC